MKGLPNPASPDAPQGGEDDFVVLDTVGTPRDFASEGFEPRDHLELGQLLVAIDADAAPRPVEPVSTSSPGWVRSSSSR